MSDSLLTVADVLPALEAIAGRRFGDFMSPDRIATLQSGGNINKGMVGQVLEQVLGVGNSSRTLDLADGELKTHKSDTRGMPTETVAITSVMGLIDEMYDHQHFNDTRLFKKIRRAIYVPAFRDRNAPHEDWMFFKPVFMDLDDPMWSTVREQLHHEYDAICEHVQKCFCSGDKMLHGTPAPGHIIQIRTKDSQPYTAIYSQRAGRAVSDKNYAYYFTKDFVLRIHRVAGFTYGSAA